MPTEVEMRLTLLLEARNILFRHWEEKVFVERASAEFAERPPKVVSPPTIRKIMRVATELHEFVQGRQVNPPAAVEPAEPDVEANG